MPLCLVEYCLILLAIVEGEVNDVGGRSVGNCLEVLCVYGEENVLETVSIKVARYESLPAESLHASLVSGLANLSFEFNVLHCVLF